MNGDEYCACLKHSKYLEVLYLKWVQFSKKSLKCTTGLRVWFPVAFASVLCGRGVLVWPTVRFTLVCFWPFFRLHIIWGRMDWSDATSRQQQKKKRTKCRKSQKSVAVMKWNKFLFRFLVRIEILLQQDVGLPETRTKTKEHSSDLSGWSCQVSLNPARS